ncbi:MAG: hypothetical protein WCT42_03230 [Candidatus Paceibacterota bacterium]
MHICKTPNEIYSKNYPYLIVKVKNGIYMLMYTDKELTVSELMIIGLEIYEKNKLESCIVSSSDCSFYVKSYNYVEVKNECPSGGVLITNSDFKEKIVYEHTDEDIEKIKMAISHKWIWQKMNQDKNSFYIRRFISSNGTYYPDSEYG